MGSSRSTFGPLFGAAGVTATDTTESTAGHVPRTGLRRELGGTTYIGALAGPAFPDGEQVLGHLAHYRERRPTWWPASRTSLSASAACPTRWSLTAMTCPSATSARGYCVLVHRRLRRQYPDPRLVLLTHEGVEAPDGVVVRGFLPGRMKLPHGADFLVPTPGWATATGAAVARVPTLFVLGGPGEYHEAEEFDRFTDTASPPSPHRRSINLLT
ncbi:hypothetical protein ABZ876_12645 [Streptomyces sp. NPDC046931]|uniref:hypothetical protein n=1 Tax=Streptomyces sp. NPDC046931 TaxID=3154806 RepID=UPI0033F4D277